MLCGFQNLSPLRALKRICIMALKCKKCLNILKYTLITHCGGWKLPLIFINLHHIPMGNGNNQFLSFPLP